MNFTSDPKCYELWKDYESSLKKGLWFQRSKLSFGEVTMLWIWKGYESTWWKSWVWN